MKTIGNSLPLARIPLPGTIGGYGGGTWDVEGGQMVPKTPVQRAPIMFDAPPQRDRQPPPLPDYLEAQRPKKREPWRDVLGSIFDAMSAFGGGDANYWGGVNKAKDQFEDLQREYALTRAKQDNQARLRDAAPFSSGRDRLRWNPDTSQIETLYKGHQDFESYADTLNLKPGSDEYFKAVEDYVLRGHGPTALERSKTLDDYRTGNDLKAEGTRFRNRMTLRQLPTYRDTHGTPPRRSAGPTATGPNGEKIMWNGKEWVPVR
ncbi:MAG: hypothetical protein H6915_05365 [Novosphingobium sp.]|nr:hypothetical protein [Novosphingobium sp.]